MRDVDAVIEAVRARFPEAEISQLRVRHPGADDDGLWFFSMSGAGRDEIQIESPDGMCPFLIETTRAPERRLGRTVPEVVNAVCEHLATADSREARGD